MFSEQWSPKIIAQMNETQFKLVKLEGDFVWHSHDMTDEVFVVLEGKMNIEFRDACVEINQGEMLVVPNGVEHKPYANAECHVLVIERADTTNTGETGGEMTAANDVWI
jgi:mannose-6-phosphate isomerase-like protein (cupin superfamily)